MKKRKAQKPEETGKIRTLRPEDFLRQQARYSAKESENQTVSRQTFERSRRVKQKERGLDRVGGFAMQAVSKLKPRKASAEYYRRERAAWALPEKRETNFTFIACLVLLSLIGLIMVTSSSVYFAYNNTGDSLYFFKRQLIWLAISTVVLIGAVYVPLKWYRRFAFAAYVLSIILLVAVMIVGEEINGSKRWLGFGDYSFQPSEFAKIATALFMALLVDQHRDDIQSVWTFAKLLIVLLIPTCLILIENLSTAIVNMGIGLVIMFVGGARIKHFLVLVVPLLAALVFIVTIPLVVPIDSMPEWIQPLMEEWSYRTIRVRAWLNPWDYASGDGYQAIQSLYAVGSGGLFGVGLGQSVQKLGFIPEAHNDIIFAVLCEELGLVGAGVVLLLFAGLVWNGIKIAVHAPNQFSSLLAVGMITQVAIQVIINVAVNTNSIPVTGVTLPFISYGGSSLLFLMGSMGILLNISRYSTAPRR